MNDEINIHGTVIGELLVAFAIISTIILYFKFRKNGQISFLKLMLNFTLNLLPIIGLISFYIFYTKATDNKSQTL
jgi:hypothetical protein|tara:strand:- start:1825 stop:2049 length:225 start_codon:yes stop_codon:yes gene_type:complete